MKALHKIRVQLAVLVVGSVALRVTLVHAQGEQRNQARELAAAAARAAVLSQPGQTLAPPGYVICPDGHPFTGNGTAEDVAEAMKESTKCRPVTPDDEPTELGSGCKAGLIVDMCNPETDLKIEMLIPSYDEIYSALQKGMTPPPDTFTEPHP